MKLKFLFYGYFVFIINPFINAVPVTKFCLNKAMRFFFLVDLAGNPMSIPPRCVLRED